MNYNDIEKILIDQIAREIDRDILRRLIELGRNKNRINSIKKIFSF